MDDFELVTDEVTGESVLRLKPEAALRKGLMGVAHMNFEVVIDPLTGQSIIRMKEDSRNRKDGARVEIVTDAVTGKQTLRMVVDDDDADAGESECRERTTKQRFSFVVTISVTENNIDLDDFERMIDPVTGREVLRMKADALKAKGLEELANAEFEIVVDEKTGQSRIILKTPSSELSAGGNVNFEIVVDCVTGKQKIVKRTITGVEDGKDESNPTD